MSRNGSGNIRLRRNVIGLGSDLTWSERNASCPVDVTGDTSDVTRMDLTQPIIRLLGAGLGLG